MLALLTQSNDTYLVLDSLDKVLLALMAVVFLYRYGLGFSASSDDSENSDLVPTCKFKKLDERAVMPDNMTDMSIGYDLTAIEVDHDRSNDLVTVFKTGLAVEPPPGYYMMVVPRSSLYKTGYMLANSVGIIDADYRGDISIACIRVAKDNMSYPHLKDTLPFCKFQLIMQKENYFLAQEVEKLTKTSRGAGGFGSTDQR